MTRARQLGRVYHCPVCGAELTVISSRTGEFAPRCCNTAMLPTPRQTVFYRCPVCGAMVMIMLPGRHGIFKPRCCNTDMLLRAA